MGNTDYQTEVGLVKDLSGGRKRTRAGALSVLYKRYNRYLASFARQRLIDFGKAKDILTRFWLDAVQKGALADYKGDIPLEAYMTRRLDEYIQAENRSLSPDDEDIATSLDIEDDYSGRLSEEERRQRQMEGRVLGRSLALMVRHFPKDAGLVWLYLKGMDSRQMAKKSLPPDASQRSIADRAAEIEKRLFAPNTGSLARFEILVERCRRQEQETKPKQGQAP
ncbi:MAG: hypothetical protein QMD09_11420 [Desulfatibacillaceae bacterium]|nr:hypothetical protein [Desulfatibacillaceae bacterium]